MSYKFGINDKVKNLSVKDFEPSTGNLKKVSSTCTVMFYANWCGHCVNAKPKYGDISNLTCCQVLCSAVDCSSDKSVMSMLENSSSHISIRGFPTFIQYKDGKFHREYLGDSSDKKSLLRFVLGIDDYQK